MTKYEYLITKAEEAIEKATEAEKKGDKKLLAFYKNAAGGFMKRAESLTVEEAGKAC